MRRFAVILVCAIALGGATEVFAGDSSGIASISIGEGTVTWRPLAAYPALNLTVAMPGGQVVEKTFPDGAAPSFASGGGALPDGQYGWELRVVAGESAAVRGQDDTYDSGAVAVATALAQSGSFAVAQGRIVDPSLAEEAATKDVLHYDDVIITGSLAVGFDATNGMSFGFDTIILKENNLRIFFDDTSTSASFPRNDWRLEANSSQNGGDSYLAIQDATAGRYVFRAEAGARSNALHVDSSGRIGFGTATPREDLHIIYGDTPCVRLDQQGGGWSPQIWDVTGNEANFFIRDVTNGSRLPFRIQPSAPTNTLYLGSNGYVGMGTQSPGWPLEVETTGEPAQLVLDRTDGGMAYMGAGHTYVNMGSGSAHPLRLMVEGASKMSIGTDGYVGIGTDTPGWPFELETTGETAQLVLDRTDGALAYMGAGHTFVNMGSGSWNHLRLMVNGDWKAQLNTDGALYMSSGASCTLGGVWTNSSSRELKSNIESLSVDEATEALAGLDPVKYNYRADESESHVGFVAEDVPNLVATKDRKGMSPMDVTAVLTKVVQEQQQVIADLQRRLEALEAKAAE